MSGKKRVEEDVLFLMSLGLKKRKETKKEAKGRK